jgi:hypothetical protein
MSSPEQIARARAAAQDILDAARTVLDALADVVTPPGELAPPAEFTAEFDPVTRRVTSTWAAQADAVEYHELETDPENTLKETLPPGATVRVSSELKGGHEYVWAARSRRGDQVSEFVTRVMYVPRKGEQPDGEDPGGEGPGGEQPGAGDLLPTTVLPALKTWTVALPTGAENDPDNDYAADWGNIPGVFYAAVVDGDPAVVFQANAGGVTTENSDYPRSEGREMAGDPGSWIKAEWSSSEPHALEWEGAIDASDLEARPRLVGAQIHGGGDDVLQLMLHETDGLGIMHRDGKAWESLDPDYVHGQRVTVKIVVVPRPDQGEEDGTDLIQVYYQGRLAAEIDARGTSWYWKVGAYVQSSPKKSGERPDAVGRVVIWRLVPTGDPLA